MTTIARDSDGVAHIRAASLEDALAGQGYAAAEDRLWQMESDRRKALGRLAQIVGTAGVTSDRYHLRLGLADAAQRDHDSLDEDTRGALRAYARGVNRFLDRRDPLPIEFEVLGAPHPGPWEPWHSIAVFKVRHLWMGTADAKLWRTGLGAVADHDLIARLWPKMAGATIDPVGIGAAGSTNFEALLREADGVLTAVASLGSSAASNNLVLGGDRTATGLPIVAGDPHHAIDLPNVYWQNHLTWTEPRGPGGDVIGLSFPGVPGFPHFGHNNDLAWCITHGMADDQDVFVEILRPTADDGTEYFDGTKWTLAESTMATIPVAGGADETVVCVETAHGRVIAGSGDGMCLSMQWTGLADTDSTMACLMPMLRATSVAELDAAFVGWVIPVNNVLMADRSGSIAYRMRGRLAVRPEPNQWTVVDGTQTTTRWQGFVDDGDLPRFVDPDAGYLVTANNRIGDAGPYVSNDWAHPARANRLRALIESKPIWSVDDVGAILGDTHSAVAASLSARLSSVLATSDQQREAQALLTAWDHHMDSDSAAAVIYAASRAALVGLLADRLEIHDTPAIPGIGYTGAQKRRALHIRLGFVMTDRMLVSDNLVAEALRIGLDEMSATLGPDLTAWRWGAVHTAGFHHPLAVLRPDLASKLPVPDAVELGGDNECVWASGTLPPSLASVTSPVARYVFDLADWDNSRWIVPHGVSGDARSGHHGDQLSDWAAVQYRPMRFGAAVVDAATVSVTEL